MLTHDDPNHQLPTMAMNDGLLKQQCHLDEMYHLKPKKKKKKKSINSLSTMLHHNIQSLPSIVVDAKPVLGFHTLTEASSDAVHNVLPITNTHAHIRQWSEIRILIKKTIGCKTTACDRTSVSGKHLHERAVGHPHPHRRVV